MIFLRSIFGQVFDIRHYCAAVPEPRRRQQYCTPSLAVVLSVRESTQWGNCWLSSSLFLSNSSNVVMRRFGDSSRHERKRNVAFFRLGQDGTTLLVWPSRIPYRIPKFISALGADEFLAMLEDKNRGTQFKKKIIW